MKAPITDKHLLAMMWERFPEIMKRGIEQPAQRKPLTDEQKRELIKKSAVWDMHLHVGWYSAPSKSFVEKAIQLISDIEAAHGIKEKP